MMYQRCMAYVVISVILVILVTIVTIVIVTIGIVVIVVIGGLLSQVTLDGGLNPK